MKRRLFGQSISALTTALCLAVGLISLPAAAETKLDIAPTFSRIQLGSDVRHGCGPSNAGMMPRTLAPA